MEIIDFKEEHIEDAAILFQKNYSELIEKSPYLPVAFNRIDTICANLQKITEKNPSLVAIQSNKVVGYISGYSDIKEFKGSFNGSYVPEWAHSSIVDDREHIYEQLYRTISKIWADKKNFTHAISFLENSKLISTFQLLGFGMQVIDAVAELDINGTRETSGYAIETAKSEHISHLKDFNLRINRHLESPPIFLKWEGMGTNSDESIANEFLSDETITLLAFHKGEAIACIRGEMNSANIPILDQQGTFGINFGYTKSEYRNTGVASALLREILKMAKAKGCRFTSVDFETQNIEGRNFWLKYYDPLVYSMIRKIDDRII